MSWYSYSTGYQTCFTNPRWWRTPMAMAQTTANASKQSNMKKLLWTVVIFICLPLALVTGSTKRWGKQTCWLFPLWRLVTALQRTMAITRLTPMIKSIEKAPMDSQARWRSAILASTQDCVAPSGMGIRLKVLFWSCSPSMLSHEIGIFKFYPVPKVGA